MAVTRDGMPIRCWTFPGNENDQAIIRTVEDDLGSWNLRRLVWVCTSTPATRSPGPAARMVSARSGSWGATTPNRRSATRCCGANLIEHLLNLIEHSDTWSARRRSEFVGSLKAKPGLRRYLRATGTGLLRIDAAAAAREAHLDGKWLLRTSDLTLTAEDLAAAYKQLFAVENGWRVTRPPHARNPRLRRSTHAFSPNVCPSTSAVRTGGKTQRISGTRPSADLRPRSRGQCVSPLAIRDGQQVGIVAALHGVEAHTCADRLIF
ncbi:MAG: hypothetical protein ABR500_00060 [Dermatophilaceae bacterium]|nr:hypothetical protein [Intrasporangiaceae bacterium]